MALITGDLPIIGQADGTEEPKIVSLFRAILEQVNGNLDTANLAPAIVAALSAVPGEIRAYAGARPPTGFLLCDGSPVSRRDYAQLFGVIGDHYGAGDGSTTFNVPDLVGRVPVGEDSGGSRLWEYWNRGQSSGQSRVALTEAQMPVHAHGPGSGNEKFWVTSYSAQTFPYPAIGGRADDTFRRTVAQTDSAGSGQAHDNMPPYLVVNYMIKT